MKRTRREMVAGAAAAAGLAVLGFDRQARAWTGASGPRVDSVPQLVGELSMEPDALDAASTDFGGLVSRTPWAVLRPGGVEDVVAMVQFARRHRLPVAMRGQAHSTYGQAQADGGLVIDSRTLNALLELTPGQIHVQAGVTFREVILAADAVGQTPLVLTDYVDLSVGGVLSAGGIGGTTHRHGMVVDTCVELTVVTGKGELVTCSATQHPGLFRAVLGGLGQYGIIVAARIVLDESKPLARIYQHAFPDLASFMAAQRKAVDAGLFDFVAGLGVPLPTGGFQFLLQLGVWYAPEAPPDDPPRSTGYGSVALEVLDLPYVGFLFRVDETVALWQQAGVWETPHPWSDLILPDSEADAFMEEVVAQLSPADIGLGIMLLYPFKRGALGDTFVQTPQEDTLWQFDLLRTTFGDPGEVQAMVAQNRALLDAATAVGGKRYPISAVPVDRADWRRHYGSRWPAARVAKALYDPLRLLAPGQGIFD